ncbi:MAG: SsrA-binding protein SmpB [Bacteroidota bacterium]
MADKGRNTTVIQNRKARYEYKVEDVFSAGIVLKGTEVKSLRAGNASLQEAYCFIEKGEVFIKDMTINEYENGSYNNHDPQRLRKLLLSKREIKKLIKATEVKGFTIVPLKLYFNKRNYAKMDIAAAQGKKNYDKRNTIKERDTKRELDRAMKDF